MKPLRVFVIQPFNAKHSDVFWNWCETVCTETYGDFKAFRADTELAVEPRLQDRIDYYIKRSDICIADLLGVRNENVLLEVGAAYTLNIPVILVSDKQLPADIIGNLYVNLEIDKLDNFAIIDRFKSELSRRLLEASRERSSENKKKQFIVYGYASRRTVDFFSLIKRCQERAAILTTNLGFIVNEELDRGFDQEKYTVLQMLDEALSNKPPNFSMRILTLDPDSSFTNERASALEKDRQEFREHMRQDLITVKNYVESDDCNVSVQVKIYDEFPLQMTYFFDNIVVSSVVAVSQSSRECITYIHSLKENGAKETYEKHFDRIWNRATLYAKSTKQYQRKNTWKRS
jgi:hypothetical protein